MAVVFQCLHVLAGALGMFFFVRLALKSNAFALFAAITFQLFGGFYSNAEHPDIVRAFSLIPWFFYCFYFLDELEVHFRKSWRHLFIPFIVWLLATGGYPGNFISTLCVMGLFVVLQLVYLYLKKVPILKIFRIAIIVLGGTILGGSLSFYHLGPGWFYRRYMSRSEQSLNYFGLGSDFLPGLFLNNNIFSEVSMTSSYVTLPALVLLAYLPFSSIKKWWPIGIVLLFAVLMIPGPESFFWYLFTKHLSPLRLSRFVSSDYRAFVVIPLIFFATLGAKNLIQSKLDLKQFCFRSVLIILLLLQGIYVGYSSQIRQSGWTHVEPVVQVLLILCASLLVVLFFFYFPKKGSRFEIFAVGLLIVLAALDGNRVLPHMKSWQVEGFSSFYSEAKWPLSENGNLLSLQLIDHFPQQRPARVEKIPLNYSWEGYVTGKYIYGDLSAPLLKTFSEVDSEPVYKEYMLKAWSPILLPYRELSSKNLVLSPADLSQKLQGSSEQNVGIQQVQYGINQITYQISLNQPTIVVENETYFPGWKAHLDGVNWTKEIEAVSTNGIFRTWLLPGGTYRMIAYFKFPNANLFIGISLISAVLWIGLLFLEKISSTGLLNNVSTG
jgi:hypothetical protein